MKAEIIASGTELLLGEVADTNTAYIAAQLALLGLDLYYVSIVGDNYQRFSGVLRNALQRSDIVIITGGLGPTQGDITRDVVAGTLGESMRVDPALEQQITAYFARLHIDMPLNNLKQATLIPSALPLPNPLGSAPGWWVEKDSRTIILLPGPPGEMQPMWQAQVHPRLVAKTGAMIVSRTLKTWGLSEALIDQMVGRYMSQSSPTLALYAKPDGIQLRITAKAANREEAVRLIEVREKELRDILGEHVWGVDKDTLESLIGTLLKNKGYSLASAETLTGGQLAWALNGIPDSSRIYRGGLVLSSRTRRELLISDCGVDSEPDLASTLRLAAVVRTRFQTDIGVAIDGFTEEVKGILTGHAFIAVSCPVAELDQSQVYSSGMSQLPKRSVMQAFLALRKTLLAVL